jgi:carboxyl-terminal processing protease
VSIIAPKTPPDGSVDPAPPVTPSSRGRAAFVLVSVVLVTALLGGSMLGAAAKSDSGDGSLYKYLSVFTEVLSLVRQSYVDATGMDGLMAGAMDGTTDALDPFSVYVPQDQVAAFAEAKRVGASRSGLFVLKERGMPYAVTVAPDSPAAKAGLETGDLLAKLQGRSTRLMPLWEIWQILAGAPGSKLDIETIRRGEAKELSFQLADAPSAPPQVVDRDGVAMLRLGAIDAGAAAQVEAALRAPLAQERHKLLLDLRGSASSDPAPAYAVAALFAKGDLGALLGKEADVSTFRGDQEPVWKGEIVVLQDRGTLGAAEVLATVLRQRTGAKLVGERTFGYAGRQTEVGLSNGAVVQLTDAFYAGPDRERLRDGLKPDVLIDERSRSFNEQDKPLGDLILERGLRLLAPEPAKKAA